MMKKLKTSVFLLITVFIWTVPWTDADTQESQSSESFLSSAEIQHLLSLTGSKSLKKPKISFYPKNIQLTPSSIFQQMLKRSASSNQKIPKSSPNESNTKTLQKQLTLLNSVLGKTRKTNEQALAEQNINNQVNAIIRQLEATEAPVKVTPLTQEQNTTQSLALLNFLLENKTPGSKIQDLLTPPALRETTEKETANFLANLLLNNPVNKPIANFQSMSNPNDDMDTSSSNQLSSIISLLGTISSLGGGSQVTNLLNLAQPQQSSGLFSTMFRQNQNSQLSPLASLLGSHGSATMLQPASQPPGVVPSLVGLGSSVSSLVGNTFRRLSGTQANGTPRVRGFDTRLGLGYRLGQLMDAQMMWEVGPQIFTHPLEGERRDGGSTATAPPTLSPELESQLAHLLAQAGPLQKRQQIETARRLKAEQEQELRDVSQAEASQNIATRLDRVHSPVQLRSQPRYFGEPLPPQRFPQILPPVPKVSRLPPVIRHFPQRHYPPPPVVAPITPPNFPLVNTRREDPLAHNEMLTPYEKRLLAQSQAQGFSRRSLDSTSDQDENSHWKMPPEMLPTPVALSNAPAPTKKALKFKSISGKPAQLFRTIAFHNTTSRRRLVRKSDESASAEQFAKRMGRFGSRMMPPAPPPIRRYTPQYPNSVTNFYSRPNFAVLPPRSLYYSPYVLPPRQLYPSQLHYRIPPPPTASQLAPTLNPYQNFIPESDDSFNRRNAIVTKTRTNLVPDEEFGTTDEKPVTELPAATQEPPKGGSMISDILKKVKASSAIRALFPTTTRPPPGANFVDGDYNPTEEPILIATPTATPVPTFFDHLGRPRTTQPPTPTEHPNPMVHIGEQLSYDELASTMDLSVRPRVRTYNGTKGKVKETDDQTTFPPPLHPPGMEMFIDIDSGQVSIRKPLATLAHFGDVTTTVKPMTDDEREDAESLKIYERLQNHFKTSMEEYQLQREILAATKEHKEKIKKQEDDSLGMVTRYFDLLEDEDKGQSQS